MNKPIQSREQSHPGRAGQLVFAGIVIAIGAMLRFWNVGQASLWLDEAGVAYAARMATIPEVLAVVRSHVMAMPLDYLVVWLVARIRVDEAALRLPAVLWGIASLAAAYVLSRRIAPRSTALWGLLLLALSPLHIQYSQELRFYSSLVFFYLLSTLLLLDAIHEPSPRRWAVFAIAHVIGVYFHPYVLLAWFNGLVWAALTILQRRAQGVRAVDLLPRDLRLGLLTSGLVSLIAFFIGYRMFSAGNFFVIPLMVFEESPLAAVAVGLGWLPFQPIAPSLSWLWGMLIAVLQIIGVVAILRRGKLSPLAGVVYSVVLQLAFVLGSDLAGHYFFAPRQLLMLQPLLCLLAAAGAQTLLSIVKRQDSVSSPKSWTNILPAAALIALVMLVSVPAIAAVYSDDKGNTRSISEQIVENWQDGDLALVAPSFDGFVYKYYLESVYQRGDIADRLYGAELQTLHEVPQADGSVYLITPLRLEAEEIESLRDLRFEEIFSSIPESRYAKRLWLHKHTSQ
jgi:uncharacterized membrane protein